MEYFELTSTCYVLNDLHFTAANEMIGRHISKAMLLDPELSRMHEAKGYKFFVYNSLYPLEEDKTYKAGRIYVFKIRSLQKAFIDKVRMLMQRTDGEYLKVIACDVKKVKQGIVDSLYTVTPVIITVDNKPWLAGDDVLVLSERLQANLEKKYNSFYSEEIKPVQSFMHRFQVLNTKPLGYRYKGKVLLGNKLKIWINDDEVSQNLAFIALGSGIGEKNSSLGAGFCTWG